MVFQLRDYQVQLIDRSRQAMLDGSRSVLMVAPTGAGKTALAAHMLGTAATRGKRSWFMVHRRELVTQSSRTFDRVGIEHGIVSAGFSQNNHSRTTICSVQTLTRRLHTVPAPDLIVWDECHHIASESWAKIFSHFPDVVHVGLTATPCRLDGRGLGDWFNTIVEGPTTKSLIQSGFLSPYKYFAPSRPDVGSIKTRAGDYANDELAAAMDTPTITGDAIRHYQRHAPGRNAIVFATNIEHSKHIVQQFASAGYSSAHLDGSMSREVRDATLKKFECGQIKILSNVDLFGEGFDVPAIHCAILLRPTQSTGLYLQQVGRALRTHESKSHAVILDHAGNVFRHGLPDEIRDWSLDSKARTAKQRTADAAPVTQCKKCYATYEQGIQQCPYCGHIEVRERVINHVDGELTEVTPEIASRLRRREQASAKTFADLVTLATVRKYRNPNAWARHVYKARMRKHGNETV